MLSIATIAQVMNSALTGFPHERAALTGTVMLLSVSADRIAAHMANLERR